MDNVESKNDRINKEHELIHRIDTEYPLNNRLKTSIMNDVFRKILAAIETEFNLKFTTKPGKYAKGKSELSDMIRYDHTRRGKKMSLIWVYFCNENSRSVNCRLAKFHYSSPKVKQPKQSDNRGYPSFTVHDVNEIEEVIMCLNEYLSKMS